MCPTRATSNIAASVTDVEHGLYLARTGAGTSPGAPGCTNGASTCAGTGSHGYTFSYANGGTSALPSGSYLAPYRNIVNDPNNSTFKSNGACANSTKQEQFAIKGDGSYDAPFLHDPGAELAGGFRYGDRKVNRDFDRYPVDGTGAGNVGDPHGGSHVYYQGPGYGTRTIPYRTALSNPAPAHIVANFGVGSSHVKDPVTRRDPVTCPNNVWSCAGAPNTSEKLFGDRLSPFRVHENTCAGYLMGGIGNKDSHVHLNIGFRNVCTNLKIDSGQTTTQPTHYTKSLEG